MALRLVLAHLHTSNLGAIGNSNNANFTSNATATPGTGIDINSNFGFRMFWSTVPLAGQPTTGRYQYSDITITFSTPVDNPNYACG